MNFQEKLFETTADLRSRASALATEAFAAARVRADVAAKRVEGLKGSFEALSIAGREFNKVARRHAVRFVKENASIAADARKDVSDLARSTYASLAKRPAVKAKARKPASRKRATAKAA